jgi:hypothetical protein
MWLFKLTIKNTSDCIVLMNMNISISVFSIEFYFYFEHCTISNETESIKYKEIQLKTS